MMPLMRRVRNAVRRTIKPTRQERLEARRWQDRTFQGHVTIGPVVIYGANAMHWAINVRTRLGWICAHPPTRTYGGRWPWYFYVSPDATPTLAHYKLGSP